MNRQPIRRKTPMKRGKPLRRVSKKNWWEKLRPKLKIEFQRASIILCEAWPIGDRTFKDCWRDDGLTFAHSRKRADISGRHQQQEVALLCLNCHRIAERMPKSEMTSFICGIIANRTTPVRHIP